MAKTTSDSILGAIRKFELMLTRRAGNMLGGGLRSPSAFLVIAAKHWSGNCGPVLFIRFDRLKLIAKLYE